MKDSSPREAFVLRLGLIGAGAVVLQTTLNLWFGGMPESHPSTLLVCFAAWALGMSLLFLAALPRPDSRWSLAILASLVFALLLLGYTQMLAAAPLTTYHTDNEMISQFAAEVLRRGQNPYEWNFSDMLRVLRDAGPSFTPFLDGAMQNRLTYPALPPMLLLAFGTVGLGQPRTVSLVFHILLLVLVFAGSRKEIRPLVLLPLFILSELGPFTFGGVQDIVWSALLVGVILVWPRPVWRAVLFGVAASFRQQPWFVVPFLAISMWNEPDDRRVRLKRIGAFLGISAGVFLAINLPFLLWDARAWALGALEPVYAQFDVISLGVSALTQSGLLTLPREAYTVLQATSYAAMLVIHWRHTRQVGRAFWIFPAIFFWFYYRSLPNYWIYWLPPLLVAVSRNWSAYDVPHASAEVRTEPAHTKPLFLPQFRRAYVTGALVACFMLPGVAGVLYGAAARPSVQITYAVPFHTIEYGQSLIDRLTVHVVNLSDVPLAPRFSIQRATLVQAVPWRIASGPETLRPGESGDYAITADDVPVRGLPAAGGGQIVMTDAGGDYALRAILDIPPESTFSDPDAIRNPGFTYWGTDGQAPDGWALQVSFPNGASAALGSVQGQVALAMQLRTSPDAGAPAAARLSQSISFPAPFAIWVHPDRTLQDPTRDAYGIQVDDGARKLWILFGDSNRQSLQADGSALVAMRAPIGAWSRQTIDLAAIYSALNWPLPPRSIRDDNNLEFPVRQIQLSLISVSDSQSETVRWFGPIEQSRPGSVNTSVQQALDHPDAYYVDRGDEYLRERNTALAEQAYLRALAYNNGNPDAYFGLAESRFWSGSYPAAIDAYSASLALDYARPDLAEKGIGWAEYNLGQFAEARQHFQQALHLKPDLADAYNGLGWTELELRDCTSAVSSLEIASQLDPAMANAAARIQLCQASGAPPAAPPLGPSK